MARPSLFINAPLSVSKPFIRPSWAISRQGWRLERVSVVIGDICRQTVNLGPTDIDSDQGISV